jgi:tRNA G37 N-methylase Trm5
MMSNTSEMIDMAYDALEGCDDLMQYHSRHGTPSLLILTKCSPKVAQDCVQILRPSIEGKRVIEIGAGVGYLALEMARYAKSVVAIEADPAWSWIFTRCLYKHKPTNLTWVFGSAETMVDAFRGDVAVVCTNSGTEEMTATAAKFAPKVLLPIQNETFMGRTFTCDPEAIILANADRILKGFR